MRRSLLALLLCYLLMVFAGFVYYPKWKQSHTEATISWDAGGYYLYLPAIFIYKDLKELKFQPEIIKKYKPSPHFDQAFVHEQSGNRVMKYSCGQAIQFAPFFAIAHVYASASSMYEADGFSRPYQFMMSFGALLIAFLGLFVLSKILRHYFSDGTTALTLILVVFGSNYLDYSAINGAMTHNTLFTIYTLLILTSIKFHKEASYFKAIVIGLLIGLAALTRPTEIIACLIPILWGLEGLSVESIKKRLLFFKKHLPKLMISAICCLAVGSLQLIYWKYVSGDWIVYSYEDQGFSWLRPHLLDGLFSYRSGWLTYSPVMYFALLGFVPLFKDYRKVFWACLAFGGLFIYIAFAWDIWWYGGSLGQRTMVQTYPIFAFPMAAFLSKITKTKWLKYFILALSLLFIYYNLWLTHQAHKGGLLKAGEMTRTYFWKTLGRYEKDRDWNKFLDTNDNFKGEIVDPFTIVENNFEKQEEDNLINQCDLPAIEGSVSLCINQKQQHSPLFIGPVDKHYKWVRASAVFRSEIKEWDLWQGARFHVRFFKDDVLVKDKHIRPFRILKNHETRTIFFDAKAPKGDYNKVGIEFMNGDSEKRLLIDELKLIGFD